MKLQTTLSIYQQIVLTIIAVVLLLGYLHETHRYPNRYEYLNRNIEHTAPPPSTGPGPTLYPTEKK